MAWPLIKFLPTHTHFKFVRLAPFAAIFSALLIVGSCVSFFTQGLNLGIDFKGGTLIEVLTPGAANLSNLRNELTRIGVHDAQVQGFGAPNSAMLRFRPTQNGSAVDEVDRIKQSLSKTTPGIVFKRVEVVGPKVSGELFKSGFVALGIAIALMLVYIWFRFQLQFGLGAVIAVFHDIVLTLGLLSVLQIEFAMTSIAALLTVIGYSMNEKVITFDRLRENLRKYRKMPLRDVIDLSENERLSRTLITGTTALLALCGALFLGGPALFPLVITMMFGILIGTYSSVYVALPVILLWGVRRNDEPEPKGKPVTARP